MSRSVFASSLLQRLGAAAVCALTLGACGRDGGGAETTGTPAGSGPGSGSGSGGTQPPTSLLSGVFVGPVGATVTLQNNGVDDLVATVPVDTAHGWAYNQQTFQFAAPLADGRAYAVTLKASPSDQVCAVYGGASGSMPAAGPGVLVGCERLHDMVSLAAGAGGTAVTAGSSVRPVIGGDASLGEGRFVAFASDAPLAGSSGNQRQVFWRDRLTGNTVLVSKAANGAEGNGFSDVPAISADGLHVVFQSDASNLVAGDSNGTTDIFMWSAASGGQPAQLQRISVGAGGQQANGQSMDATVSADGQVVAFISGASNLTSGVADNHAFNVIVRDLATGINTLVSADANGNAVGGEKPALSEDGRRLAFWSASSQIVAGDNNGLWDIFVFDRGGGRYQRVSLTASGGEREQGNDSTSRIVAPAISGNGRYVAYATTAANIVAGDSNGVQDVYVVDTQTGAVVRASVASNGAQGDDDSPIGQGERVALSYDGTWIAFSSLATTLGSPNGGVFLRNLQTGQTRVVAAGAVFGVGAPGMSRNGAYVVHGADTPLDPRFNDVGLFSTFTGLTDAYFW